MVCRPVGISKAEETQKGSPKPEKPEQQKLEKPKTEGWQFSTPRVPAKQTGQSSSSSKVVEDQKHATRSKAPFLSRTLNNQVDMSKSLNYSYGALSNMQLRQEEEKKTPKIRPVPANNQ